MFSGSPHSTLEISLYVAVPVPPPACTDGKLQFTLPPAPGGSALSVQAKDGQISPPAAVRNVDADLSRGPSDQFHIVTDTGYTQGCTWLPFGTQLTLWNCCYFSCPDVICLPGARLTLSWTRSIQIRDDILPGMDQTPEYRPVMRPRCECGHDPVGILGRICLADDTGDRTIRVPVFGPR